VFHIELRQFPHNLNRFNLTSEQLWQIVEPWAREKVFELEKQKWTPHHAKLIIIEGPELTADRLTMGRGWPRPPMPWRHPMLPRHRLRPRRPRQARR
jgi:hypothetical protein